MRTLSAIGVIGLDVVLLAVLVLLVEWGGDS